MIRRGEEWDRRNTTRIWNASDSLDIYSLTNNGGKNYLVSDVNYAFNSYGLRCDEFSIKSDIRLLFAGCSFTEGVGLPLHHCWPHHILTSIRNLPGNENKSIPFHSIAVGASGPDSMARLFANHVDEIKPAIVLYYLFNFFRREYCIERDEIEKWLPNYCRSNAYHHKYVSSLNKLFFDKEFASYQCYRSMQLMDFAAKVYNTKVIIFYDDENQISFQSSDFSHLIFVPIPVTRPVVNYPPHILSQPYKARDNAHPGAAWQYDLYSYIWSYVQHEFILA